MSDREALAADAEPSDEEPLMVKRLVPDGMLIPGELLLDAGFELPADAPPGAMYRLKAVGRG